MAGTGSGNESRERLLRAATEYIGDHGVADLSLRGIAAGIGTSHRMLLYHFGSKEGLLIAVIRAVEAEQRRVFAALEVDPTLSPVDMARAMWAHFSDPALWPNERLFFEMYGQALQGRARTDGLLDDIVESWLDAIALGRESQGVPPEVARAQARLGVALTRGLLLDLLATGDRAGTDAAMEAFIALWEAADARSLSGRAPE